MTKVSNLTTNVAQTTNQLRSGEPKAARLNFGEKKETFESSTQGNGEKHPLKAVLSFIIPGSGQVLNGEPKKGLKQFVAACLTLTAFSAINNIRIISKNPARYLMEFKLDQSAFGFKKRFSGQPVRMLALGKKVAACGENIAAFMLKHAKTFNHPIVRIALFAGTVGFGLKYSGKVIRSAIDAYHGKKAE